METDTAKIRQFEDRVNFLEMKIENLLENFSTFRRPDVKTVSTRLTSAQIARWHGYKTRNVTDYHGIFKTLREFERRNEANRTYFDKKDYDYWLAEMKKTPKEKRRRSRGN